MNPARTIGPDLVALDFTVTWVYIVGPLLGGGLAIIFDRLLHGPPSSVGATAAQGLLAPEDPAGI
jgi:aquaporin Z